MEAKRETSSSRRHDEGIAEAMSRSVNEEMRRLSLSPMGVKRSTHLRR